MSVWAYFYCAFYVIGFVVAIKSHIDTQPRYHVPGEILSFAFAMSFFFMHYDVIPSPSPYLVSVMLVYVLYWTVWENRYLHLPPEVFEEVSSVDLKRKMLVFIASVLLFSMAPVIYVALAVILRSEI